MKQFSNEEQFTAQPPVAVEEIQQPQRAVYETPSLEIHNDYKTLTGVPTSGF